MVTLITAIVVFALVLGWHGGHVHANQRHTRASGRKPNLWLSSRGVWASIPGPAGTRIGHRL